MRDSSKFDLEVIVQVQLGKLLQHQVWHGEEVRDCSCSCLPVLPGFAWVLLSNILHTF